MNEREKQIRRILNKLRKLWLTRKGDALCDLVLTFSAGGGPQDTQLELWLDNQISKTKKASSL
jgi:hypothetical protein